MRGRETRCFHGSARGSTAVAAGVASLSWLGLVSELVVALQLAAREGRPAWFAVTLFWRFFTNLTVLGVALLMTATAWRAVRHRSPLSAKLHAAALVYILVVCVTYELLLRRLWTPRGIWFVRDALMHDVVPLLTLVHWLAYAPKRPLSWSDPARWLCYPIVYLVLVMSSAKAGFGYPYPFFDVERLGIAGVARVVLGFAAAFVGFGFAVVAAGKALSRRAG